MALMILEGRCINEGEDPPAAAVLYCGCTGRVLPVMFNDADDAEAFISLHGDVRRLSDEELTARHNEWVKTHPRR